MSKLGYSTSGADADVTVLRQGFNVDPLLQKQADCISTMIYNEYWQIIDAGMSEDELITFFYEDQGVATLEDGLYALEENLQDPEDRKSTRRTPVTNAHLVCRLLLEKKKQ